MSDNKKKYVIIGIVVIVFILLLAVFFFLYSKNNLGTYRAQGDIANSVRNFLPFGNIPSPDTKITVPIVENTGGITTPSINENKPEEKIPKLRHIYTDPVSGLTIFNREREVIRDRIKRTVQDQYIRFVDRATGHILETRKDNLVTSKVSNTTIPRIYEAKWSSNPNILITRLLDDDEDTIITYKLEIGNTSTTTPGDENIYKKVTSKYLETDLNEVSVAPKSLKMISVNKDLNGDGQVVSSTLDGGSKTILFSSPISGWLIDWSNDKSATLTSKPSGIANGIVFLIDVITGKLTKIASGNGITALTSPDLLRTIVAEGGDSISTRIVSNTDRIETNLSLRTLPEKCVWAKTENAIIFCAVPRVISPNTYPDAWYQGLITFTDIIWKINTRTGFTEIVGDLENSYNQKIDAINLTISSDDSYLAFINKKDLSLWGLRLKDEVINSSTSTPSVASSTPQN